MSEVKAQAKFQRISPRKVRLVVGMLGKMNIEDARNQLKVLPNKAAYIVLKVLNSAVANAENNNKLKLSDLIVKLAYVDQGPTLKRFRPRAFGRAAAIRKRTSHITIVVGEKESKEKKVQGSSVKVQEKQEKKGDTKKDKKKD